MSEGIERAWPLGRDAVEAGCPTTVHIVERLAPGGIETLVLDIVRGSGDGRVLSLQGDRYELLAKWPALGPIGDRIEGFRRHGRDIRLIPRLARALRAVNAKAVFLHHMGPLLYGGLAARLAGVSTVVYVEHDAWHYESRTDRLLTRGLVKFLGVRLVAVSEQVADRLRAIMPGREVAVVPPGIDTERFAPGDKSAARQTFGLDQAWRIVGSVGRLQAVKGQRFLIEAMKELPDDVHAVLVGDGPLRAELEQLAQKLSLDQRVHFLGHRDDLDAIYPAFDIFCLPSLSEGLPRTLLEAQASGVPVVATDVGGIPEAVCDLSGILVPAGEANTLAAALVRALERGTLSESPRAFVLERMSLKYTMQKYQQLAEA
jgi:glycosyltransferase involved in cell wall biosynthesis